MDILVLFLHFKEHCDSGSLIGFLIYLNHRGGSSKFHFRWNFFWCGLNKGFMQTEAVKDVWEKRGWFPWLRRRCGVCWRGCLWKWSLYSFFYQSWVCYTSFSKYKITVTGYMLHCSLYFLIHFIWLNFFLNQLTNTLPIPLRSSGTIMC